jgi:hypothetical protein
MARSRAQPDGSTTARPARGGVDEQDVVQGRPRDSGEEGVAEFRRKQQEQPGDQTFGRARRPRPAAAGPGPHRLALRRGPAQLLISGGLQSRRTGARAALVDVPLGRGHIVMFSFNPFWRSETLGSYACVFNALLHHGNLAAGQAAPAVAQ